MYECPVCGSEDLRAKPYATWPPPDDATLTPPYENFLGSPSYEVCPTCDYEFGNDDNPGGTASPASFADYRAEWMATLAAVAETVLAFFKEHEVASLRLPSGWFGRPHDNWHQLTEVSTEGGHVRVRLDETQLLTLKAEATSSEDRVLRVAIRGGRWDWTDYGGDQKHTEVLGRGDVEFHAPFHR